MKKRLLLFLLFIASCSSPKQEDLLIHNLDADFPMSDTVTMKHKQTFEIMSNIYDLAIKDTILFAIGNNSENMGYCYNITNGTLINTIINYGRATNEVLKSVSAWLHRDSIQFINHRLREIKSISMDDISTKMIGERYVSTITLPKAIGSFNYKKIDNNVVIGYNYKNDKDAKYFIYKNNELTLFGEYNKKILESTVNQKITTSIAAAQYEPMFANSGSKIVSADRHGITLELIDINTKSIIKERFYTKFVFREQLDGVFYTTKPADLNTKNVYCTDREIYCIVTELDKVKTKEKKEDYIDIFILVFDWDLNPLKKYYIGSSEDRGYNVCMTDDCKKFYYLANEGEKQTLFEGIIN